MWLSLILSALRWFISTRSSRVDEAHSDAKKACTICVSGHATKPKAKGVEMQSLAMSASYKMSAVDGVSLQR
jgi:hypothetical protein